MTGSDSQLSAEQIRELEQARKAYRVKALPLERELVAKWSELETLLSEPAADLAQVTALRRQVSKLERELEDLRVEADAQVGRMLSPEQRNDFGYAGDFLAGHDRWSWNQGCPWYGDSSGSRWQGDYWWGNRSEGGRRGHCC